MIIDPLTPDTFEIGKVQKSSSGLDALILMMSGLASGPVTEDTTIFRVDATEYIAA